MRDDNGKHVSVLDVIVGPNESRTDGAVDKEGIFEGNMGNHKDKTGCKEEKCFVVIDKR